MYDRRLIIGYKIKQSRIDRGLSQRELGRKIARSRSQISKWETGKQEICSSALFAIAYVLKVDIRFYSPYTALIDSDNLLDPRNANKK